MIFDNYGFILILTMMTDIESIGEKVTDTKKIKCFVQELITTTSEKELPSSLHRLQRKYKIGPSKNQLRDIYETYFNHISLPPFLELFLIRKSMRSRSGVLVSTIVLSPGTFSCTEKCAYCPTETDRNGIPTQPKSYLSTEPAMLRAIQYNFDVTGQLHDRIHAYIRTGNIKPGIGAAFKFEIIFSGGTWEAYPFRYRNQVMNELYWAANTFGRPREMLSLEEECNINETATYRIIGMTIETRPDYITKQSIRDYRRWGVTRVQLGVQHYDDSILDLLQRNCNKDDTIQAIHMLKQAGFKVVCHLMPDLPGSSPEKDRWMFQQAIKDPLLQFDDVKIYPTAVCQSKDPERIVTSTIAEWYQEGSYVPYSETQFSTLLSVLKEYKEQIQPWVRIQRLVRDIPSISIEAGYHKYSNLRQMIHDEMKKEGRTCQCIRCMEIDHTKDIQDLSTVLVVRKYEASYGTEYFISYEMYPFSWYYMGHVLVNLVSSLFGINVYWSGNLNRKAVIGFCRLRIDNKPGGGYIKEIEKCGLIREVHVYGSSLCIGSNGTSSQHKGYGKQLVHVAEDIITSHSLTKSAVIAGVGTREYYKNKCGYTLQGTYMVKSLQPRVSLFYTYMMYTLVLYGFLMIVKKYSTVCRTNGVMEWLSLS